jgi:hypothetical protein
MGDTNEEPSSNAAKASVHHLNITWIHDSLLSPIGHYPSQWMKCELYLLIYLLEQVLHMKSTVKQLQAVTSVELNKLLRESEGFTINLLTEHGSLLKVVSYSTS